jgi:hypothetical protein
MPGSGSQRLKELRHRCEARLRDLPLPVPFDIEAFVGAVAARNGRPIVLKGVADIGARTMGVWIPTPDVDIIVYEEHTSRFHQEHILLHELSHIICGHQPLAADGELAAQLFPDLSPEVVRGVLQRHAYSSDDEFEAEVQASVIRERAAASRPYDSPPANHPELVNRLEAFSRGDTPN